MAGYHIRVGGFNQLERHELTEQLDKDYGKSIADRVSFENEPIPEGTSGEPITLIAVVGGLALKGLIAYLVLRGKSNRFKGTFEVQRPDGTRERYTVEHEINEGSPASEQIVEKLAAMANIPAAQLQS